jgi:D-alanine-D-alanine ligase
MLALAGLKVSGPHPQACALAMDKLATAALAAACRVPTIPTTLLSPGDAQTGLPAPPWVVKPRFGGSSLGVEAGVEDIATARNLAARGVGRSGTLIQPLLAGWNDLNVAVRTYPELAISEIERPLRDEERIYGYQDKYLSGGEGMESAPRELPAKLPPAVRGKINEYARALVENFGLTGAPRIDFLGDEDVVLCEVNAIPGAWGAYLWIAAGVPREQLYGDLVAEAMSAPVMQPQWAASSDGRALRVSGSIAAKLG